jgi:hypothetical protein
MVLRSGNPCGYGLWALLKIHFSASPIGRTLRTEVRQNRDESIALAIREKIGGGRIRKLTIKYQNTK